MPWQLINCVVWKWCFLHVLIPGRRLPRPFYWRRWRGTKPSPVPYTTWKVDWCILSTFGELHHVLFELQNTWHTTAEHAKHLGILPGMWWRSRQNGDESESSCDDQKGGSFKFPTYADTNNILSSPKENGMRIYAHIYIYIICKHIFKQLWKALPSRWSIWRLH